jgi:hypothetical protein
MSELYQNKNWLENKYLKEKLSSVQIGGIIKTSQPTIWNWLKRFNIPIRSIGEANHFVQGNHCNLTEKAIEWINGELLGDGCLQSSSIYSARFNYGSKYPEYIQYVSDILKSFGIKQGGKITKQYYKETNCYAYLYASLRYAELFSIYKKWYPDGKKIIPRDIILTPSICKQWYIGDGSLIYREKGKSYIELATNGFSVSDVRWLVKELIELGFRATRRPSRNTIGISTHSTKQFLDYIGSSPVECYQYKWNSDKKRDEKLCHQVGPI